jgi:Flp pilus assembly pilin Flp
MFVTRARADDGQTMSEYAILIAWVALVVIVGGKTLGSSISRIFSSHAAQL